MNERTPVDFEHWRSERAGEVPAEITVGPEIEPNVPKVTVNVATRQIETGERSVVLDQNLDWGIFMHLARNREDISAQEITRLRKEIEGGKDISSTATSYFINRIRRALEENPEDPKILIQTGQKKGTKYRLNADIEVVGEKDRWKYVPVPSDRLRALQSLVMNIDSSAEDIVSELETGNKITALGRGQAWIILRGANNALSLRAAEGLLTPEEKITHDRLKMFWSFNKINDADEFKSYIHQRILGRDLVIKEKINESKIDTQIQDDISGDQTQNLQVLEPGLRVNLPKVDRLPSNNRQERLMAWYEKVLKLYSDSSWATKGNTWGEIKAHAKVRQRAVVVAGRIENELEKALSYSEEELITRKEQLRELSALYERNDFSTQSTEFFQRKLKEYRVLSEKERVKPGFETLKQERGNIPLRIIINNNLYEAIVGDKAVKFDDEAQWQIFSYLVRRRGQEILPKEIMDLAKESGINVRKVFLIINDLRQLIGDNQEDPKIILMSGHARATRYSLDVQRVESFEEKQVEMQADQAVVLRPERITYEAPTGRNRLRIESKDPNIHQKLKELAQNVVDANLPTRVTLSQLTRAFSSLVIKRIRQSESRGIITPVQGFDQHPVFSRREIAILLYDLEAVRKGQSLSKKEAREIGPILDSVFAELENSKPAL